MSLIFPSDLGSNAQSSNYMGFQAYTLTGGLGSGKSDRSYILSGDPVFLPIPVEGVQDQYVNNWGAETQSMAKMALGGAVKGLGAGVTTSTGLIDTIKNKISMNVKEAASGVDGFASVAEGWDRGNLSMDAMEKMAMGTLTGASPLGVGMAVGTLGNAVVQSTGIAGFEETSVTYQGPQFRNFSFNFSLKPLTQKEQFTVGEIVDYFKLGAAPQELSGTLYRIYSLPKVFQIKFYHKDGESETLTKIGKCALTNIGIKYGGDRFQTFATDHAPVQTDISLQFIELVLQTQNTMGGVWDAGGVVVDDFGGMAAAEKSTNARNAVAAAKAAKAADAAAAANVDDFGAYSGGAGGAEVGAVDDFGSVGTNVGALSGGEFGGTSYPSGSGSALKAIKSKASGGASFVPSGGGSG